MVYHTHLLVNANTLDPLKDPKELELWLTTLVDKVHMKVAIPARAYYVDQEGNRGLTGVVGIETSHMAIHIWDDVEPAIVRFDLYTCGELCTYSVLSHIENSLKLINYEYLIVDRENGFKIMDGGRHGAL